MTPVDPSGTEKTILLDGRDLSQREVVLVASEGYRVRLAERARDRVIQAADYVLEIAERNEVVYGVNTGFGKNAGLGLDDAAAAHRLQHNLIVSHAVGVGEPVDRQVVRAVLLIRINTLLKGHSGIRLPTLDLLVELLNRGVHPVVPAKGSVGASGDLAPLSHVGLALIGLGDVEYRGEVMPTRRALEAAGLKPIELTYKEGLAINNSTALMTAFGVLGLDRLRYAAKLADCAAAVSLEAAAGRSAAFDEGVHQLRPHPGQLRVAANIRTLVNGSTLVDIDPACVPDVGGSWRWNENKQRLEGGKSTSPQDSYSLRCVPQVHGAARDIMEFASQIFVRELCAVTDNPILFPERDCVISAGNFHGMPVAFALSTLKPVISTLASISERRVNKLVDAATSDGLPFFLINNDDSTQSGLMIVQYTAAALVNDLVTRSHSAVPYSIPTCANIEDHVSMGANEGRHVYEMLEDLEQVLALELLTACQALEIRLKILNGEYWGPPTDTRALAQFEANKSRSYRPGDGVAAILATVREHIPYLEHDRELRHDIAAVTRLVQERKIVSAAEQAAGPVA